MPFFMHLEPGRQYMADIAELRVRIPNHGPEPDVQPITVSHHEDPDTTVDLYINLAFSRAEQIQINASLYTVAFSGLGGSIWCFTPAPIPFPPAPPPWQPIPGVNGSYSSFGYPQAPLPRISDANLFGAIQNISRYVPERREEMKRNMALLIIAVNEAIRFEEVANGVNEVLGTNRNYLPPWDVIHNWSGHTLGDH